MTSSVEDLETEVHYQRINDLASKLEQTIHEAGYQPCEVLPAFAALLVTRFTEASDPDRMFRFFVRMLTEEHDDLMTDLENGVYDDPEPGA